MRGNCNHPQERTQQHISNFIGKKLAQQQQDSPSQSRDARFLTSKP